MLVNTVLSVNASSPSRDQRFSQAFRSVRHAQCAPHSPKTHSISTHIKKILKKIIFYDPFSLFFSQKYPW
ncbi:hypothetical protein HA38_19250 [Pantoea allii]|nr:hypothetical protein HA38_19250 [Pantoea allii]PBK00473.1 hypothetical protein CMR03_10665 [Pantoea allii]